MTASSGKKHKRKKWTAVYFSWATELSWHSLSLLNPAIKIITNLIGEPNLQPCREINHFPHISGKHCPDANLLFSAPPHDDKFYLYVPKPEFMLILPS